MIFRLESAVCTMQCQMNDSGVLRIQGTLRTGNPRGAVVFAANPIQRMTSYSGSALPYPTREIAMENTPNYHMVTEGQGAFTVDFWFPNAFSTEDARQLVPPTIFVKMIGSHVEYRHDLPNPFPFRSLTYRPETRSEGPDFYMRRQELGVQGQDSLIRQLAEPNPYRY